MGAVFPALMLNDTQQVQAKLKLVCRKSSTYLQDFQPYLSSNPFCGNAVRRSTKYPAYDPEGQVMLLRLLLNLLVRSLEKEGKKEVAMQGPNKPLKTH